MGNPITIDLGDVLHTGSLGEILAYKPIGVFIRAAFPGMVGRRKIACHREAVLEDLVAMKLGAVIEGNGPESLFMLQDGRYARVGDFLGGPGSDLLDYDEAGFALDEGHDAMMAILPNDGIAFPMANIGP